MKKIVLIIVYYNYFLCFTSNYTFSPDQKNNDTLNHILKILKKKPKKNTFCESIIKEKKTPIKLPVIKPFIKMDTNNYQCNERYSYETKLTTPYKKLESIKQKKSEKNTKIIESTPTKSIHNNIIIELLRKNNSTTRKRYMTNKNQREKLSSRLSLNPVHNYIHRKKIYTDNTNIFDTDENNKQYN